MFDSEIRGQLAMLMGGRAAELLTCTAVSTGAVDDIRRATDLAYRAVSVSALFTPVLVRTAGSHFVFTHPAALIGRPVPLTS